MWSIAKVIARWFWGLVVGKATEDRLARDSEMLHRRRDMNAITHMARLIAEDLRKENQTIRDTMQTLHVELADTRGQVTQLEVQLVSQRQEIAECHEDRQRLDDELTALKGAFHNSLHGGPPFSRPALLEGPPPAEGEDDDRIATE